MFQKFCIFFIALFLVIFSADSALAAKKWSNPVCPSGQNFIVLSSSPTWSICLEEAYMSNLQYGISDYKSRLDTGWDIIPILTEIRESMKNNSPEYSKIYAIMLDRIKKYASSRCNQENQKPKIIIQNEFLYAGYTITSSCTTPEVQLPHTQIFLDISVGWSDIWGNKYIYQGSGWTFSWINLNIVWKGKHTIKCGYRPNYCTDVKSVKKEIQVNTPLSEKITDHSIARIWNEIILSAIRRDTVRPPVQARNLFHISAAMYDVWALYNSGNTPYLFGKNATIRSCQIPKKSQLFFDQKNITRAMSYTAYRLIKYRYRESPGYATTLDSINSLMNSYGFAINDTRDNLANSTDATTIGNAVAKCYIEYGKTDGSNEGWLSQVGEWGTHANQYYASINPPLNMNGSGWNTEILDWNRWQPLSVGIFIDQGGNSIPGWAATFIWAEWGNVQPFSLREDQKTIHERDGHIYPTYLDPGSPPQILSGSANIDDLGTKLYKWNFELVWLWSSHLDPRDNVMIDISPTKLGNTETLPTTFADMMNFYDIKNGGTKTLGRSINPKTGNPYTSEIVPRGDYTRAIAEFWADGPSSETPPGHWFSLLNTISDKIPNKYWEGKDPKIDSLEWDIKSYFTLGGAMHDAAIWAWWAKWAYDCIRPVSALRALASRGQSTDKNLPNYDPLGMELIPGYIEIIGPGDALEWKKGINRGKIKMRAWKWPKYVFDPNTDFAGVDWILAENWWPYQRSSFVTPPFSGYVSWHSTFSRAAAEVLTSITGDEYFPWWLLTVPLHARDYLVFEQWPSRNITLQWATYRDAANESALSRIWWGIHPPMDDIPGRLLWEKIGKQAVIYASSFFKK